MNRQVAVQTEKSYDVVIGRDVSAHLRAAVDRCEPTRVAVIHPEVLRPAAVELRSALALASREIHLISVPDSEDAKTIDVVQFCWSVLADAGFTRSDLVIGYGGGATTDLAGFVAASWLRGVRFITVPTTVLGMVDAAVGGKTGINLAHGKNLVGAFHEPQAVVCDLEALRTLAPGEIRSGMAEILKCGFIADISILDDFERDPALALDPGADVLVDLIERGVKVKAAAVSGDLHERTADGSIGREALNYGHTLGHAIESHEQHLGMRHGEAISVGMVFAAELAHRKGGIDDALLLRHRRVLTAAGLPISYAREAYEPLLAKMKLDKKTRGDQLRFVVLQRQKPTSLVRSHDRRPGRTEPVILAGPDPNLLRASFEAVSGPTDRDND